MKFKLNGHLKSKITQKNSVTNILLYIDFEFIDVLKIKIKTLKNITYMINKTETNYFVKKLFL